MTTKNENIKTQKAWQMPDTYVIIFFIVVLAWISTHIIPVGSFEEQHKVLDAQDKEIVVDQNGMFLVGQREYKLDGAKIYDLEENELGQVTNRRAYIQEDENGNFEFKVIKEYGNYIAEIDENGNKVKKGVPIFEKWGEVGFLNFAFEGLVSGDKWGSAVGVMAFILIIGGAFGIVLKTGAVDEGILTLISKSKGAEIAIIPIMFFLFSLGGAIFGMGEEAIAFAMIIVPLVVGLGYDAITAIMITYVATQIGFATSWMNPFSVVVAQGIAGISGGVGFRISMWVFFTAVGIIFTVMYAISIKKNPKKSLSYESDEYFRNSTKSIEELDIKFNTGHGLILFSILLTVIWIVWGVWKHGYYLPEIASVFFTMGLIAGVIGVIFKLNNMKINDISSSFRDGAKDLLGAAMVVGLAKGIMIILGDSSATEPTVLNTILYSISNAIGSLSATVSAWLMFVFQSVFNFFVVSGSGQAALTMPLMAPLADLVGVSRQVSVVAFQLGDGFTNLIVPTSASLMGVLGVARLDWNKWFKFQIKFQGVLFLLASIFVVAGVLIGLN